MADWFSSARRIWRRSSGEPGGEEPSRAVDILLVVAVVLALAWLGREWIADETGPASDADRTQLSRTIDPGPSPPGPRAGREGSSVELRRCMEVYTAQARPLEAVTPAMTQWEVHIGAMNQLVVGAITLQQAKTFWSQTREGAARNLAEYGDAQRLFAQRTARCPMPLSPTRASEAVRVCAAVVSARHRELRRADLALDTWHTHVEHMEMLRRGEMTPEEATRLWLKNWREGDRQVEAYRGAARVAERIAGSHGHHHGAADGPCAS